MLNVDPEIWVVHFDMVVPCTMKHFGFVVRSAVHISIVNVPNGYAEIALYVHVLHVG